MENHFESPRAGLTAGVPRDMEAPREGGLHAPPQLFEPRFIVSSLCGACPGAVSSPPRTHTVPSPHSAEPSGRPLRFRVSCVSGGGGGGGGPPPPHRKTPPPLPGGAAHRPPVPRRAGTRRPAPRGPPRPTPLGARRPRPGPACCRAQGWALLRALSPPAWGRARDRRRGTILSLISMLVRGAISAFGGRAVNASRGGWQAGGAR